MRTVVRPSQAAKVKVTAYDYSIYGRLDGGVSSIPPDTIRDEVKLDILYYRVFVRTDAEALVNKADRRFPITPGMVAIHRHGHRQQDRARLPAQTARTAPAKR